MGNMRKSQLSKAKQDRLIECLVAGASVRCAVDLVSENPKTAIYYFHRLCEDYAKLLLIIVRISLTRF
jgi:transposase